MTFRQNRLPQSSGNNLNPIYSLLKGILSSLNLNKVEAISLIHSLQYIQEAFLAFLLTTMN